MKLLAKEFDAEQKDLDNLQLLLELVDEDYARGHDVDQRMAQLRRWMAELERNHHELMKEMDALQATLDHCIALAENLAEATSAE
jgi:ABC-type transporter Mla subunit MlaD